MANKTNPNPAGNKGKPFTLAPMTFDDALRKILAAPPPEKQEKETHEEKAGHAQEIAIQKLLHKTDRK